jgi:hypothetical protein
VALVSKREILFFSGPEPPLVFNPADIRPYLVEKLKPGTAGDVFLKVFDGTVFVMRNRAGQIVAHAGIKNKGILREIAVGVEPAAAREDSNVWIRWHLAMND